MAHRLRRAGRHRAGLGRRMADLVRPTRTCDMAVRPRTHQDPGGTARPPPGPGAPGGHPLLARANPVAPDHVWTDAEPSLHRLQQLPVPDLAADLPADH